MIAPILIALGANLPSRFGPPQVTLEVAKDYLTARGITVVAVSQTYKTAPVPISDDPWYFNEVVSVETTLTAEQLLRTLLAIEAEVGRIRGEQNAPRVLDLDLLAYGQTICSTPALTLPHPRLSERAFVLYPLRDVAPQWIHPVSQQNVAALITALPANQEIDICQKSAT